MTKEIPLTEVEAVRVLQAFNMVVQKNERLENSLFEAELKVEGLEATVLSLTTENVQLKRERDAAMQRYLKATAQNIDGELSKQAMESRG